MADMIYKAFSFFFPSTRKRCSQGTLKTVHLADKKRQGPQRRQRVIHRGNTMARSPTPLKRCGERTASSANTSSWRSGRWQGVFIKRTHITYSPTPRSGK